LLLYVIAAALSPAEVVINDRAERAVAVLVRQGNADALAGTEASLALLQIAMMTLLTLADDQTFTKTPISCSSVQTRSVKVIML